MMDIKFYILIIEKNKFFQTKHIYYFNEAKTVQTTFPDNLQVFKFENGQVENILMMVQNRWNSQMGVYNILFQMEMKKYIFLMEMYKK